ncbi:hypothetical protein BKA61DRAFT_660536 [Leptodontidium sp. MPI-SDFR-AT-0119]|nr:hypothetical protein BKA61DRAFT_660536 [Leptodontidium sp. MPI-SDFR-AT-0119]
MADTKGFEMRRLENLKHNGALLETLGIHQQAKAIHEDSKTGEPGKKRWAVERASLNLPPSRSSARIALRLRDRQLTRTHLRIKAKTSAKMAKIEEEDEKPNIPAEDLEVLQESWTSWQAIAPPPTRDEAGVFNFDSYLDFTPNKSPEEVLREGCFGGCYFRPLYSRKLGVTISDDYQELHTAWTDGLNSDL